MKENYIVNRIVKLGLLSLMGLSLACSEDNYEGDVPEGGTAIRFNTATDAMTRAERETGWQAASNLGFSFVVYGVKYNVNNDRHIVFDHYNVEYKAGSASLDSMDYKGWDYVDIEPVNQPTTTTVNGFTEVNTQPVKYWDRNYSTYDFIAFSRGTGKGSTEKTYAEFTPINMNNVGNSADKSNAPVFTVTGNQEELGAVYVSDRLTVERDAETEDYDRQGTVTPEFRRIMAKVNIALYETVPGYSVSEVKFYKSEDDTNPGETACMYSDGNNIPMLDDDAEGTARIYYPTGDGKPAVVLEGFTNGRLLSLNRGLRYTYRERYERDLFPDGGYTIPLGLGPTSAEATYTNISKKSSYVSVFPTGPQTLTLKIDFTLHPLDGSSGNITVKGVTAVVPSTYAELQPNHAYSYIFKISEQSGGLYPVTFDAVEVVDGDTQDTETYPL